MPRRSRLVPGLLGVLLALSVVPIAARADIITDSQDFVIGEEAPRVSLGEPAELDEPQVLAAGGTYPTFSLPVSGTVRYDYAWQVLELVNAERAKVGLPALAMDEDLLDASVLRAAETTVLFAHDRPNGEPCFSASDKMFGENIAAGQTSPSMVMDSWMSSEGHRNNILGSGYTTIGIGCLQVGNTYYWVQCFGSGATAAVSQPANQTVTQAVQVAPEPFGLSVYVVPTTADGSTTANIPDKIATNYAQPFAFVAEDSNGSLWLIQDPTTWSSSDANVATIDQNGRATFKASGTTTITARLASGLSASTKVTVTVLKEGEVPVWRLYNPNSGLHHYTRSTYERDSLISAGWNDEGASFYVSTLYGTPVYRNYNPNDGNHNWTESAYEHQNLNSVGWNNEGTAWYTAEGATINVYRLYNPNNGEHVYTTSKYEYDSVMAAGWHGEGVAWKSL